MIMMSNNINANANYGLEAGVIYGSVHAEFHAPPSKVIVASEAIPRSLTLFEVRVETPPRPSIVIPFGRDADFVDREVTINQGNILAHIDEKCSRPGSRTALVGLGGVGYVVPIQDRSGANGRRQ